jgi:hypothetical protein
MFAEEQVVARDGALEVGFTDVVHGDAAAFDIFAGLALGLAQADSDEEFHRQGRSFLVPIFSVMTRERICNRALPRHCPSEAWTRRKQLPVVDSSPPLLECLELDC